MKFEPANLFHHETDLLCVPAGHTLFTEGEQGDVMYVLVSGTADISVRGKIVEQAQTGALLGEMSLVEDAAPRSASVTTTTECKLAPIDAKRFHFLIQNTPNFAVHVMRVIATRLRNANKLL
ncbi:cyclic nucleotide-binding protein [Sulfuriferula sp. AH1]|uniref:cyclic nucleotide-binding domain-containing protein n=1 Tax=Sulfuriferula sp. AH1 TaxID=1985873 RepID=UPI000B3B17E1|nr:cyclic nucleotide-binding domain-containing protein [Sulfuriferula sp. AH1]ARU30366.1 cyclic nucleotide-binding protein [Sulfuriferula sp. AH1]